MTIKFYNKNFIRVFVVNCSTEKTCICASSLIHYTSYITVIKARTITTQTTITFQSSNAIQKAPKSY